MCDVISASKAANSPRSNSRNSLRCSSNDAGVWTSIGERQIGAQRGDASRYQLVGFHEIVIAAVSEQSVVQRGVGAAIGDVVLGRQRLLHRPQSLIAIAATAPARS